MKIRWFGSLLALTSALNYDKSHLKKEKHKKNKGQWFTPTQKKINHLKSLTLKGEGFLETQILICLCLG